MCNKFHFDGRLAWAVFIVNETKQLFVFFFGRCCLAFDILLFLFHLVFMYWRAYVRQLAVIRKYVILRKRKMRRRADINYTMNSMKCFICLCFLLLSLASTSPKILKMMLANGIYSIVAVNVHIDIDSSSSSS